MGSLIKSIVFYYRNNILVLVILILGSNNLGAQSNFNLLEFIVLNSQTQKPIEQNEGVVGVLEGNFMRAEIFEARYSMFGIDSTFSILIKSEQRTESRIVTMRRYALFNLTAALNYKITFSGPAYENLIIQGTNCPSFVGKYYTIKAYNRYNAINEILDEIGSKCSYTSDRKRQTIYLIPKKTIIEGNLNITTQSQLNNKAQITSDEDLGLMTSKEIAQKLRIAEDEIIKLIKNGELKGKKIGDKYFIRKDDFDEYMKK
jgi:excisionase family DNA binding protein